MGRTDNIFVHRDYVDAIMARERKEDLERKLSATLQAAVDERAAERAKVAANDTAAA